MRIYHKVGILFTIAIIFLLGFPYLFGFYVQRSSVNFLEQENQTLGKVIGVTLSFDHYQRGFFQSTANLLIQKEDKAISKTIQTIPLIIKHGPFYFIQNKLLTGVGAITNASPVLDINAPYLLTFYEYITFSGHHELLLNLQAKKKNDESMGNTSVQQLELKGKGDVYAKNLAFTLSINGLQVKDPSNQITLHFDQLAVALQALYLADRHWQLALGAKGSNVAFLAMDIPTQQPIIDAHLKGFKVLGLHIDTENMAKIISQGLAYQSMKESSNQSVSAQQWINLLQQLASEIVNEKTNVSVEGLTVNTPMGQGSLKYQVSFPGLPLQHDYFDVAMHDTGFLNVDIPHFRFINDKNNLQIDLTQFALSSQSNALFSRWTKMSFDELSLDNLHPEDAKWSLYANGFFYHGELTGDFSTLSQHMDWRLNKLCFANDCYKNINLELQLNNLDLEAYRHLANVVQQMLQSRPDPNQPQLMTTYWLDLLNAYARLVGSHTNIKVVHTMLTPKGEVNLNSQLSWPQFPSAHTFSELFKQADYQVQIIFPMIYVTDYLNSTKQVPLTVKAEPQTESLMKSERSPTPVSEPKTQTVSWLEYAIQQGYLEQKGDSYVINLVGQNGKLTVNGKPWVSPVANPDVRPN